MPNGPEANSHTVKVRLISHGKLGGDDRSFILSKSVSSIKVGRASSSKNHATSSQLENCYIPSPIMSRHHAKFVLGNKDNPLKIVDEGSTHGTFVNMVRLRKGGETALENGSIITFGTEVLNGKCMYTIIPKMIGTELIDLAAHYFPESFTVTFAWHNSTVQDTTPSTPARHICRAPSLLMDSDDDMTKRDAASSPPFIVIGSPNIIDLTEDSNSIQGQDSTFTPFAPVIVDEENHSTETDPTESEGPEELAIIKETNLKSVNRAYRFDYTDSDSDEEEQEIPSQSSPSQEDFSSLYDASATTSPSRQQAETNWQEEDNAEGLEDLETSDEQHTEDSEAEMHEDTTQDNHASMEYSNSDSSSASQISMDDEENLVEDRSSFIVSSAQAITSYEQALDSLGASINANDEQIIALLAGKVDAILEDEDLDRNCVRIIANYRQSHSLWTWLDVSQSDDYAIEEQEVEVERQPFRTGSIGEPSNNISELGGPLMEDMYPNGPFEAGSFITTETMPGNRYFPPYPHPYSSARSYMGYFDDPRPQLAPITYTPTYMAPYIPPTLNTGPSSIMQISNLVDSTPTTNLMVDCQTTSYQESSQIDSSGQPGSESDVRANEPDCAWISAGRKRGFDEFSEDSSEEVHDEVISGDPSLPPYLDQPLSPILDSKQNTSPVLHTRPNEGCETIEVEIVNANAIDVPERGPPPVKKARLSQSSNLRAGRLRTLASHCFAAAIGAAGVLAAIVATTPLQVQQELFQSM